MDDHTKFSALGFILVMATLLAALLVHVKSGGFKFGRLENSVRLTLGKAGLDDFLEGLRGRLAELGFKRGENDTTFVQGGPNLEDLASFAHSKTNKRLTFQIQDSGGDEVAVALTLHYLEVVVVDTGESAYGVAALNYLSGRTEKMATVPNGSLTALNSLIGGGLACAVAAFLMAYRAPEMWPAVLILAVTEIGVGLLAIYTIRQRPAEITGLGKAVAGVLLALTAMIASLIFIITSKVTPNL